ncbi:unnamed protein product [Effrenium voratum]|nr:unnamed protein product [Effrenium voratum]CAJ1450394.1 unnamed protein product [Effrenium voratum]
MRVATLLWLPFIADCHWQQRRHELAQEPRPVSPSEPRESQNATDGMDDLHAKPYEWLCVPKGAASIMLEVMRHLGADIPRESKEPDPCVGGFTKFFWATVLTTKLGSSMFTNAPDTPGFRIFPADVRENAALAAL